MIFVIQTTFNPLNLHPRKLSFRFVKATMLMPKMYIVIRTTGTEQVKGEITEYLKIDVCGMVRRESSKVTQLRPVNQSVLPSIYPYFYERRLKCAL